MFRNQEIKSILLKLILLQLIFSMVGFFAMRAYTHKINREIIERDMALVGNILYDHPQLKEEMLPYITKEVSREKKERGQEVLKEYGYHLENPQNIHPLLRGHAPRGKWRMVFMTFLFFIPVVWLILGEYKKIYKKVRTLASAAEKVVEGDFTVYLGEGGEGDFHILQHRFNQMTSRLQHSLDTLQTEKVFLKNTLSDISHQLKTPLSSLIMLNELLLEDKDMDMDTRITFLEKSQGQLQRMEWLIINLLKVARIEAGAIEFKKEKVYVKEVVDHAINALSPQIQHQIIEILGDSQGYFYGDKSWSGEALINILKNSLEHGGQQIQIYLEDTPLFSRIILRDNGEGIDPQHLPHIFTRFYKAGSEGKPESIGIGLNLAKIIVESQEGAIGVKSHKGQGAEFTLTFLKRTLYNTA